MFYWLSPFINFFVLTQFLLFLDHQEEIHSEKSIEEPSSVQNQVEASHSEKSVEETLSVQNHEEAYHSEKAVEETSSVKNRKKNISIWVTVNQARQFYFVLLYYHC